MKNFYTSKGHHQDSERQPTEQERLANHISDKGLETRIYKT